MHSHTNVNDTLSYHDYKLSIERTALTNGTVPVLDVGPSQRVEAAMI